MTVEEAVFSAIQSLDGFASYGYLATPDNSQLPRLVMWQVSDPSNKVFFSSYGGQARIQFEVHTADRFRVPDLRQLVVDAVRGMRGRYDDIRIISAVVANEFTRGLTTDEVYSGIVDVIFAWEKINGN